MGGAGEVDQGNTRFILFIYYFFLGCTMKCGLG